MRLLFALVLLSASACALRPHYREVVKDVNASSPARFVLVEKSSGKPLSGVKVEIGEGKGRVTSTTAKDGAFELPVSKKLHDADPMLVVTLPKGVTGYEVRPVVAMVVGVSELLPVVEAVSPPAPAAAAAAAAAAEPAPAPVAEPAPTTTEAPAEKPAAATEAK